MSGWTQDGIEHRLNLAESGLNADGSLTVYVDGCRDYPDTAVVFRAEFGGEPMEDETEVELASGVWIRQPSAKTVILNYELAPDEAREMCQRILAELDEPCGEEVRNGKAR